MRGDDCGESTVPPHKCVFNFKGKTNKQSFRHNLRQAFVHQCWLEFRNGSTRGELPHVSGHVVTGDLHSPFQTLGPTLEGQLRMRNTVVSRIFRPWIPRVQGLNRKGDPRPSTVHRRRRRRSRRAAASTACPGPAARHRVCGPPIRNNAECACVHSCTPSCVPRATRPHLPTTKHRSGSRCPHRRRPTPSAPQPLLPHRICYRFRQRKLFGCDGSVIRTGQNHLELPRTPG